MRLGLFRKLLVTTIAVSMFSVFSQIAGIDAIFHTTINAKAETVTVSYEPVIWLPNSTTYRAYSAMDYAVLSIDSDYQHSGGFTATYRDGDYGACQLGTPTLVTDASGQQCWSFQNVENSEEYIRFRIPDDKTSADIPAGLLIVSTETITPNYSARSYTHFLTKLYYNGKRVKFNANTGSGEMYAVEASSNQYTLPECEFTAPAGKKFSGWNLGPSGTVITLSDDETELVAQWEDIPQYCVTFDTNGGSSIDAQTIEEGKSVAKPVDPTKEGYTFDGWYADKAFAKPFDFKKTITASVTLYAKWEEIKKPEKETTVNPSAPADNVQTENIDKKQKNTSIISLTPGKKSLNVKWKKIKKAKGIKGYELQYSTDKKFKKDVKKVTINKVKTTSKKIKKLKSKKKYFVRIRTFKKTEDGNVYSKWSKVKNAKVK